MYDWDEAKRAANRRKHGIDFASTATFEWDTALTMDDDRADYGEPRRVSMGFIGSRLHVLVWTPRPSGRVRIISLRKANSREVKRYAERI